MTVQSVLDIVDRPAVGDEVLYHISATSWKAAIVLAIRSDGRLDLDQIPLPSQHGAHVRGWLLYEEAASGGP